MLIPPDWGRASTPWPATGAGPGRPAPEGRGGGILGVMASRGAPGSAAGAVPDPAAVRALPLDEYAALLLSLGRYRVDAALGAVVGPQGRPMVPQRNAETGYYHVMLSYSPVARRVITVHRLVAVATWGAAAVRGRHVVHRDGDRAHNAVANLALVDPSGAEPAPAHGGRPRGQLVQPDSSRGGPPDGHRVAPSDGDRPRGA